VTPILYVVGVTGNTLSAIVWLQRRMHANNSSAVYLVALSVSDLLFLLLHFVQVTHEMQLISICPVSFPHVLSCFLYIATISIMLTIYVTATWCKIYLYVVVPKIKSLIYLLVSFLRFLYAYCAKWSETTILPTTIKSASSR